MKSWKTTFVGILGAAWLAIEPIVSTGHIDWKKTVLAAIVAAFGYLAKDFDKTGTK